jgi:hypothetical protein
MQPGAALLPWLGFSANPRIVRYSAVFGLTLRLPLKENGRG